MQTHGGAETMPNTITHSQCNSLERFLKTLDAIGVMEPYLITAEMKPGMSLNRYSDIVYDQPERKFGITIRIMNKEGTKLRIHVTEDENDGNEL